MMRQRCSVWLCSLVVLARQACAIYGSKHDNEELVQTRLEESTLPRDKGIARGRTPPIPRQEAEPDQASLVKASASKREARELRLREAEAFDRFLEGEESLGPDDSEEKLTRIALRSRRSPPYDLKDIQWLHVPKSGTTFIATIWAYACGQDETRMLDLRVDNKARAHCSDCYDFALMERYPKDVSCTNGMFHQKFHTQHLPASKAAIQKGGPKGGQRIVAMFREPSQRLISAARNGHASGFRDKYDGLVNKCGDDPACWGKFPGIAGCLTRMLSDGPCADPLGKDPKPRVEEALETLEGMAFVGLVEEWDESICLFHLAFGGPIYTTEFAKIHRSMPMADSSSYDTDVLKGFVDEADEIVYAAAKKRFHALKLKLAGNKSACEVAIPSPSERDEEFVLPASCAADKLQCGLHGHLDCGTCPAGRLGFPPALDEKTVSVTCSAEGACLVDGKNDDARFAWNFQA